MAAAIAQTIAVMDKSGKVVSTSKQLKSVFMEAKFAYQERKAEIVAERKAKTASLHQQDLRRAATDLPLRDSASERSHTSRRHDSHRRREPGRPPRPDGMGRQHSVSSLDGPRLRHNGHGRRSSASSLRSPRSPRSPPTDLSHRSGSAPTSPVSRTDDGDRRSLSLVRRRTDLDLAVAHPSGQSRRGPTRSMSAPTVDMDLAYGDYHPESIAPLPNTDAATEREFLGLVERAKHLLDEAHCAQYSVQAMISHLQKNPEAMAAVALTLAEISNLASKMAPGALTMLKGSAPAVFALLASPQFLIAAGVGIGVTVVMFGGYKIIKKIKAKNEAGKEGSVDEMVELEGDEVDRIQQWRRGIAAAPGSPNAASEGTSVDGEFITPLAASMRGMETRDDLSRLSDRDRKKREKKASKESKKEKEKESKKGKGKGKEKGEKKEKQKQKQKLLTAGASETGSSDFGTVPDDAKLSPVETARRALVKVKKPSPLRRLLA